MGDPVGASVHARQVIDTEGTLMILKPMAGDFLTENLKEWNRSPDRTGKSRSILYSLDEEKNRDTNALGL